MQTKQFDLGFRDTVKFRPGTSDETVIRAILIDRAEYAMFTGCNPKIIFDVGANIGATTLLFANTYPDASIYSFEPEPSNYELLVENTKAYPKVKTFNMALGAATGELMLKCSDDPANLGGFTFHDAGSNDDLAKAVRVKIANIREILEIQCLPKIDLLKVDTEGCEFEILQALCPNFPQYIMGEAHGVHDWKLFDLLTPTHHVKVDKPLHARCFPFYALRKADGSN